MVLVLERRRATALEPRRQTDIDRWRQDRRTLLKSAMNGRRRSSIFSLWSGVE
jgi:hypothetical protein